MIKATLVKELRDKTGAGMMDCKKALVETNGDFEAAVDFLRAKGLSSAAKKADRVAAEGLTAAIVKGNVGAVVEVNSETDFVARNPDFQNLVKNIADLALDCKNIEELKAASMPNGRTVADSIVENIAVIGENLQLRRSEALKVKNGVIASYVHNCVADNLGKIAVIVALESDASDKAKLTQLGRQIAMHIAAARPQSLNIESLDKSLIERERAIFIEQTRESGKPEEIIAKMVEGRIRKFFEESVLLEQVFVIDGKTKISSVIETAAKELGSNVALTGFVRYELGEGIEQEEKNFADEVAAASKL